MGEDKLNASGFEFYEGIRIAIPGAITVALYAAVNATFGLGAPEPQSDALLGVILVFGAGLVLYYADLPGRAQIYEAAQPHRVIVDWGLEPPEPLKVRNVYFVVLDSIMPAGIRSRTLYFGSIFRIGFEAIYLTALTCAAVLTVAALGDSGVARDTDTTVLWLAAALHLSLGLFGVWEGFKLTERPGKTTSERTREVRERLTAQIGGLGAVVGVLAGLALLFYFVCDAGVSFGAAAVALPAAFWASRYLRGYKRGRGRRNIDLPSAALTLSTTLALATVVAALELPDKSPLGTGTALGWSAIGLLAELLLVTRGHEKRLWAAYYTQRAWLELEKWRVVQVGALSAPAPASPRPP